VRYRLPTPVCQIHPRAAPSGNDATSVLTVGPAGTSPGPGRSVEGMLPRLVVLTCVSVCGLLAGCSSKPNVPKPSTVATAAQTITVHAGAGPSTRNAIEAHIPITREGTYQYVLTFPPTRPSPAVQPAHCFPLGGFRLVSPQAASSYLTPGLSGVATGSIVLTAGIWNGISGVSWPAAANTISPPSLSDAFWAVGCPWSLTLTPAS
jgi:hypothetical protein